MHAAVVKAIVILIIGAQIFFVVKNLMRMYLFSRIFALPWTWCLRTHPETGLVNGVNGKGNRIFESIVESINKYLEHNSGSVIDFGLLKDAVDRHCDSEENDISTQIPIPLYCGLAGTMIGVIVGLLALPTGAIETLLGSHSETVAGASQEVGKGIDALLNGVAWAMIASIAGIGLTTLNSLCFKNWKLKEERGKNSFLAWMQSELLPKVSSDYTVAFANLVRNLNQFNTTFARNTQSLGLTLETVNQSYATQADIVRTIHEMDVTKMATCNVEVLRELQACTDKLTDFNRYLTDVQGYTDAIHRFEQLFKKEAERVQVLEEIRDFFRRHKSEIAKSTADADDELRKSLAGIQKTTNDFQVRFVDQSEVFNQILQEEKKAFEKIVAEMRVQWQVQLEQMPQVVGRLDEIAAIPAHLNAMAERFEASNADLAARIEQAFEKVGRQADSPAQANQLTTAAPGEKTLPKWMKITAWGALVFIALVSVIHLLSFMRILWL